MRSDPFLADGGVYLLTREVATPPGFEQVSPLEAWLLLRGWGWRPAVIEQLRELVRPLRLLRRLEHRPVLEPAPPVDLVDLEHGDRPEVDEAEHWIELRVLDEAHTPLSGIEVELAAPDGKSFSGRTNDAGAYFVDGLFKSGSCRVELLDLHESFSEPLHLGTDRVHTIVVPGLLFVHLALVDFEMSTVAGAPCVLQLGGTKYAGTTDGEGAISFRVSSAYEEGEGLLSAETDALGHRGPRPILLAPIAPVTDPAGQRLRLDNLGYIPVDAEKEDPPSQYAIEEFQCDHGLPVTGLCDGPTQAKLCEVHGH